MKETVSVATTIAKHLSDLASTNLFTFPGNGFLLLFTFLECNINDTTVFYRTYKSGHLHLSCLQLIIKDIRLNHTSYFRLQATEGEEQGQEAGEGPLWIFLPFLEVSVQMQDILN